MGLKLALISVRLTFFNLFINVSISSHNLMSEGKLFHRRIVLGKKECILLLILENSLKYILPSLPRLVRRVVVSKCSVGIRKTPNRPFWKTVSLARSLLSSSVSHPKLLILYKELPIHYYSTFQLFCRDISCYISVVFKDLKLKLGICNLLKKCMLNIKNHWNRTILKGTFFFAPIKWATSGLVRSAQNWFQSKRYVVKIVTKNSQPKKSISTRL